MRASRPPREIPARSRNFGSLAPAVLEVEHAMAKPPAAVFEPRGRALGPVDAAAVPRDVPKIRRCVQDLQHPGGVRLPVRGELESPARLQAARDERREIRLDDPPLV